MLRKVTNCLPALALIPVVKAAVPIKEPQKPPPMRPSDLPIYEAPHASYADYLEDKKNVKEACKLHSMLSEPVSVLRRQAQVVWEQTESIKHTVQDHSQELQDRSTWIVKYLREEENKEQRYGAVAIGGLTGFIFGLRGGFIKRLFYATIGTGVMGSVCFPEETRLIAKDATLQGKHYMNVAYNFLYGVKPGDPQKEISFPELSFPKDFSEFVAMTSSMVASVSKAVMPPPKSDVPADKK